MEVKEVSRWTDGRILIHFKTPQGFGKCVYRLFQNEDDERSPFEDLTLSYPGGNADELCDEITEFVDKKIYYKTIIIWKDKVIK